MLIVGAHRKNLYYVIKFMLPGCLCCGSGFAVVKVKLCASILCLYILLLLLISSPMTRLSEETVVLPFQLTLRRISELWSAQLSFLLLLS